MSYIDLLLVCLLTGAWSVRTQEVGVHRCLLSVSPDVPLLYKAGENVSLSCLYLGNVRKHQAYTCQSNGSWEPELFMDCLGTGVLSSLYTEDYLSLKPMRNPTTYISILLGITSCLIVGSLIVVLTSSYMTYWRDNHIQSTLHQSSLLTIILSDLSLSPPALISPHNAENSE